MKGIKIVGTGKCLPQNIVTNKLLSETVDTSDDWITTRTGIKQRYFVQDEKNASMAAQAAKEAMAAAHVTADEIAYCIVATFTPDQVTPSVACHVQKILELPENIMAFDMNAACTGFLYGLKTVYGLLLQQPEKYALLIGSEVISKYLNFEDRTTCVLFGDGAGAAVIKLSDKHNFRCVTGCRGDTEIINCPGISKNDKDPLSHISMDGKEVFRFAVDAVQKCINEILVESQLELADIDYVVCHQANERIISYVYKKLNAPSEKFFMNLQKYGNTSAASIPIALDDMAKQGLLKEGVKTICVGFGAGLTWSGTLLEW